MINRILLFFILLTGAGALAQAVIATPERSSQYYYTFRGFYQFEKALRLPIDNSAMPFTNPAVTEREGLFRYNPTLGFPQYFNGTVWVNLQGGDGGVPSWQQTLGVNNQSNLGFRVFNANESQFYNANGLTYDRNGIKTSFGYRVPIANTKWDIPAYPAGNYVFADTTFVRNAINNIQPIAYDWQSVMDNGSVVEVPTYTELVAPQINITAFASSNPNPLDGSLGLSGRRVLIRGINEIMLYSNVPTFKGATYDIDYSANYGPRSIPDVAWVQSQIAAGGGGGSQTAQQVFDNGATVVTQNPVSIGYNSGSGIYTGIDFTSQGNTIQGGTGYLDMNFANGFNINGNAGGQISSNPTTGVTISGNAGGVVLNGSALGIDLNGQGGTARYNGNEIATVNQLGGNYTFTGVSGETTVATSGQNVVTGIDPAYTTNQRNITNTALALKQNVLSGTGYFYMNSQGVITWVTGAITDIVTGSGAIQNRNTYIGNATIPSLTLDNSPITAGNSNTVAWGKAQGQINAIMVINTALNTQQTATTLNNAYPGAPIETFVVAPNVGTGMMYIKTTAGGQWMQVAGSLLNP